MSDFNPAETKLTLFANNERWGDTSYYWQFRNGPYTLAIKADEFPEYDAARTEFNRRVEAYLSSPEWRLGFADGTFMAHPRSPRANGGGEYVYLELVSFDDCRETITLKVKKGIDA